MPPAPLKPPSNPSLHIAVLHVHALLPAQHVGGCIDQLLKILSSCLSLGAHPLSLSFLTSGDPERRGSMVIGSDAGGGGSTGSPVPFDLSSLGSSLPVRKTPESFLGPNAALVDLDSLVSSKPKPRQTPPTMTSSHNPFLQSQSRHSELSLDYSVTETSDCMCLNKKGLKVVFWPASSFKENMMWHRECFFILIRGGLTVLYMLTCTTTFSSI